MQHERQPKGKKPVVNEYISILLCGLIIRRELTARIGSVCQSPGVLGAPPLQQTIYILYTIVNNKQYAA